MKTVEIKIYKFEELPEHIQDSVIEQAKQGKDYLFAPDNARSLERFCEIFPIEITGYSYGSGNDFCDANIYGEDEILWLKGHRLATYIYNNYWNKITKGKYYGKLIPHPVDKDHPAGLEHIVRHSKIFIEKGELTGFSADFSLTSPIFEFLENPDETDLEDLLLRCLDNFIESCSADYEYYFSDQRTREEVIEDNFDYTEDGEVFTNETIF